MHKHLGWLLLAAALSLLPLACTRGADPDAPTSSDRPAGTTGTAPPTHNTSDKKTADAAVTARVQERFAADHLVNAHRIEVLTDEGKVTLRGSVDSKAEFERAAHIAAETEGVTRVTNELQFDPEFKHPGDHHDQSTSGIGNGPARP